MVISYIGMQTQEVAIKPSVKVTMRSNAEASDEVVVVAYGTAKKESLTGSVAVVDQKIFKDKGTVANPLQAMQVVLISIQKRN